MADWKVTLMAAKLVAQKVIMMETRKASKLELCSAETMDAGMVPTLAFEMEYK